MPNLDEEIIPMINNTPNLAADGSQDNLPHLLTHQLSLLKSHFLPLKLPTSANTIFELVTGIKDAQISLLSEQSSLGL
ncbi:hypothetical protein N7520_003977 [Penicillium odoratum]|uniref:uncharacterized protein n=1 Tax=Penicillium odoratum TaxID=1167516 RepID=UPI0025466C01|nr:uncharacterized protein N7520_003977 [Penicillium odoratum]KAJ5769418.1 hypothetical protein N7520_003977 [Penicillium odoratum]